MSNSFFASIGFEIYSSQPALRHFSSSPVMACAVHATMGIFIPCFRRLEATS